MAQALSQQYYFKGKPVDSTLGPYSNLEELRTISSANLYQGLTVVVLSPVQMECWLCNGKRVNNWRVRHFTSIPTYAALIDYSDTIFASMNYMVDKGTEATVMADETNNGKVTKYIVVDKTNEGIVWERQNAFDGIPITGDDVEEE